MKALILGGAAALALAGVAMAQQTPGARLGDTDGDQRISREEFLARHLERFDSGDQNRDGTVTGEEMQAAHAARRAEMRGRMFERLDADSDGAIGVTRAEAEARATAWFARMDANGDGYVSAEDRQARRERRHEARRGGASE